VLQLQPLTGLWAVGIATLLVMSWGAFVSVNAATKGPVWALAHLKRARPVALAALGLSVLVILLVRPFWIGVALLYVMGVTAWLFDRQRRMLQAIEAEHGFGDVAPERRAEILHRVRVWCLGGAAILVVIALAVSSTVGPLGLGLLAPAALLGGTGMAVGRV
jgi:Ca2+/Na+ antiporter